MRVLALLAILGLLSACSGVIDNCPHGLDPPPWDSQIPNPHG